MPRIRTLLAAALLACAMPAAFAQQNIQQQMTAGEFAAAGLDKLSAAELETLNRWLQQRVEVETSVVVEQAVEQGREEGASRPRSRPPGAATAACLAAGRANSSRALSSASSRVSAAASATPWPTARCGNRPTPPGWTA